MWRKFFGFKRNVIPDKGNPNKESTQCGAASISPKRGSILPRIAGLESCKMWQKSFFYARNPVPEEHEGQLDFIGMPPFVVGPPANIDKCKKKLSGRDKEGKAVASRVEDLIKMGFRGDDMVATFIYRRVLPLQQRAHKMCHMSGLRDPTRISTFPLDKVQVWHRCRAISEFKGNNDWTYGVAPYYRKSLPPKVALFCFSFNMHLAFFASNPEFSAYFPNAAI